MHLTATPANFPANGLTRRHRSSSDTSTPTTSRVSLAPGQETAVRLADALTRVPHHQIEIQL